MMFRKLCPMCREFRRIFWSIWKMWTYYLFTFIFGKEPITNTSFSASSLQNNTPSPDNSPSNDAMASAKAATAVQPNLNQSSTHGVYPNVVPFDQEKKLDELESSEHLKKIDLFAFKKKTYAGSRDRDYEVFTPSSYRADGKPNTVLMLLHGCKQTQADIRTISNMNAIAEREGFIVVYPYVKSWAGVRMQNCWAWWDKNEISPGAGEVEDLLSILEEVKLHWNIDDNNMHIGGFSSGAAMAVAAMVCHHKHFASASIVAGIPYGEKIRSVSFGEKVFSSTDDLVSVMQTVLLENDRALPLFIVHSHDDNIVDSRNGMGLRDAWAAQFNVNITAPASHHEGEVDSVKYEHCVYGEQNKASIIETLFLHGPGHGWYGGEPGSYSYVQAPNVSERIWGFMEAHSRD